MGRATGSKAVEKRREQRLILDAVMLGVVGALGAQVFTFLLHLAESLPGPRSRRRS